MTFIIRNKTGSAVTVNDLGLTIPLGTIGTPYDFDLSTEQANDVHNSVDLVNAITTGAGNLIVLDPRDGTTELSVADSIAVVQEHNTPHWGIEGGRFGDIDDPSTSINDGDIIVYDSGNDQFESLDPDTLIENTSTTVATIIAAMGQDGVDTTFVHNASNTWLIDGQDETNFDNTGNNGTWVGGDGVGGTAYVALDVITLSDGSTVRVDSVDVNGDVVTFTVLTSGGTNVTAGVALTQTGVVPPGGTAFTLTPENNNISDGTMQWDVNDVFLRNTGDTLDSGTLTIASGATVNFPAGSNLTINAAVNTATIDTPGGGFVNANDLINKGYVDALVQGIDWKESVRVATEPTGGPGADGDVGGTYATSPSNGQITGVDLSSVTGDSIDGQFYTGVPATGLIIGDRILLKDQAVATENGIYEITAAVTTVNLGDTVTLTRSPDQDGSPAAEVSGGNTTFVEIGTVNEKTIWSVIWDGIATLNTDPINWSQTGAVTSILANEGLNSNANKFNLDISTLTQTAAITTSDILAFQDVAGSAGTETTTTKITAANFISDLSILTTPGGNGLIVNNAGTLQTVSIAVNGAGPLDGLAVANADGTAGNPTLGLDILNLPARPAVDTADLVAVYDQAGNNVSYTIGDIAGAISTTNSYTNWTNTGNGSGGPIGPATGTDTIDWNGGDGIDIDMTSGSPDTITIEFTRSGLADTAIDGAADTIPFFDGGSANQPEFRSFNNMMLDLNIVNNVSPNGIVVQTAADTYVGKAIAASALEDEDGLVVTNGDGTAGGNIIVGLDIDGMTDPDDDMTATDEFPLHDKSEGTGGANRKMTGQNIAEGVTNILNITGLTIVNIDGQPTVVITDTTRTGSPQLSVAESTIAWSEAFVSDNDWIGIGNAVDALSGYIVPHKARIVKITAHTEDDNNISKAFDLYIDGASQSLFAFTAVNGENEYQQVTTDIQVAKDTKLRVRATGTPSGSIGDTVITLWLKWEV